MWDAAFVAFMKDHFRRGDHLHVGRAALHAIAWALDLSMRNPKVFPLSRLTLAGWAKAGPERAKDPAPLEAVLALVSYWLRTGVRENILSAAASLIAFDCYFRPGALLLLQRRSVTPPSKPPYKHWVLADGATGTGTGRFSKTNVFDESTLVGFNKRTWAIDVVKTLYNKLHKPPDALFLGLTLAQWERAYRDGVRVCQLDALQTTPHSNRHGGPALDVYEDALTLEGARARGRWAAIASCRRYAKFATLLRQASLLTEAHHVEARRVRLELPHLVIRALQCL